MDRVKVKVVEFGDRKCFQMQYVDPMTRKKKTRSTGVARTNRKKDRTEAERVAAKWEAELREGRYHDPCKITWAEFRQRYEDEMLTGMADGTDRKVSSVFNAVEAILNPTMLRDLSADRLSYFQAELRKGRTATEKVVPHRAESTIAGYMAHLRAGLQWAVNVGLLTSLPKIQRLRRAKSAGVMKGRPITGEEFDRMLTKAEAALLDSPNPKPKKTSKAKRPWSAKIVAKHKALRLASAAAAAGSWRHFLRGLWLSGLRLEESLELYWDREDRLCVDLAGKRPMLRIPAELEKGNKDRLLPMSPEFAEFLLATPKDQRTGPVFTPKPINVLNGSGRRVKRVAADRAGHIIARIGQLAGVKVNADSRSGKIKYASAHDLRRSFGERWATRVMPQVLMQLMRHELIDTTLRYYVGRNAQLTAEVLWAAHEQSVGNTFGNSGQNQGEQSDAASAASPYDKSQF